MPAQRNPMSLVSVKGASKRQRKPRSLSIEEFQKFIAYLDEPFRTIAMLCSCLGLRISECLALRWEDVNWLDGKLTIERGIVCQVVDDVKTTGSRREIELGDLAEVLKAWKQTTELPESNGWLFASPIKLGRQPWSYDQVWRMYQKAANAASIGRLGTHSLRHTYRTWLGVVGTPLEVQQELMRHSDIRTTLSYGETVTSEMRAAQEKVIRLALPKPN